jgi:hypothetical protein
MRFAAVVAGAGRRRVIPPKYLNACSWAVEQRRQAFVRIGTREQPPRET